METNTDGLPPNEIQTIVDNSELFGVVEKPTRKKLKPGRKPFKPTEKMLDKIYKMVLKGKIYHNEIYPKLLISSDTWYTAVKLYPEILETIEQAKADRIEKIQGFYDDIIDNPEHKRHADLVKHAIDRHDKQNQKVVIDHNITVRPYQEKSDDELLGELDD